MISKKTILYILPHHDDEIFVIPKINHDLVSGENIKFFFLMKSELRLKESRKFLNYLGVPQDHIISLGEKLNIPDGSVHLYFDLIYREIKALLTEGITINEIVCTAFEGGHHDHDTSSVIARRLASDYHCQVLEFYLYNGYGTKKKYYKVAHPVNLVTPIEYRYTFKDFLAVLIGPFIFLSQFKAMLGLWPFLLLQIARRHPLIMNKLDYIQAQTLFQHPELPLYERWGRITEKELNAVIKPKIVK
jgi:hypothetical protein